MGSCDFLVLTITHDPWSVGGEGIEAQKAALREDVSWVQGR